MRIVRGDTFRTTRLSASLADVRRPDLTAAISALQLLPENAEKGLRLKAAALSSVTKTSRIIRFASGHSLGDVLLGHKDLLALAAYDDPLTGPFCSEIQFLGHGHLVLAGDRPDSLHMMRLLTRALYLHPAAETLPGINEAREIIRAGLTLSHEVCRAAGLARNQPHVEGATEPLFVPNEESWKALVEAVTFGSQRLRELSWLRRITPSGLAALTLETPCPASRASIHDMPLDRYPLVREGDKLLVTSPSSICTACADQTLSAVDEAGGGARLRSLLDETSQLFVAESAKRLGLHPVAALGDTVAGAHVVLLSPDEGDDAAMLVSLTDVRRESRSVWSIDAELERLAPTLTKGLESLSVAADEHGIALIVVAQETGRPGLLESLDYEHPRIRVAQFMTRDEWDVFADVMEGDWYRAAHFLEDLRDLRSRSRLSAWSMLDPLDEWLKRRDSFYFGDEVPREDVTLFLSPGGAGSVRRALATRTDRRTMVGYREGTLLEAELLYRGSSIGLYTPCISEFPAIAAVDEHELSVVWVTAPNFSYDLPIAVEPHMVEAISYWMWRAQVQWPEMLLIEVTLDQADSWSRIILGEDIPEDGPIAKVQWRDQSTLVLSVAPAFAVQTADGRDAERELVEMVLGSVADRHPDGRRVIRNGAGVDRLLQSKRCRMVNISDDSGETDPRRLGRPIDVQPSLVARVLDRLGDSMSASHILPIESPQEVGTLLRNVVDQLFTELAQQIATFDSNLIARLIRESECELRSARLTEFNLASRHACFSDVEDVVSKATLETIERSEAAIAVRFLIEYVAATPCNGTRRATRTDLEQLVALASVIVGFAHESEMAVVGLGPTSARILQSGRLGLSRQDDAFAAQAQYMKDVTQIQAEANLGSPGPDMPTQAQLDHAILAEFGVNTQTFIDVFISLSDIASPAHADVGSSDVSDLVSELAERLNLNRAIVESILSRLSLEPREKFEVPPPGHSPSDLWPWRFGRSHSYLARPLILLPVDDSPGARLLWGSRHIMASSRHLLMQMATGRFKGRSRQMKELQGSILHAHGEAFNDRAATILRESTMFRVWTRFDLPDRLGDVDVLALDCAADRLWVIECKDFEMTRVPADLRNDIEDLRRAQDKQLTRLEWICGNREWIAKKARQAIPAQVAVAPLIVMSAPLLPPYLENQRIPVCHIDDLLNHVTGGVATSWGLPRPL